MTVARPVVIALLATVAACGRSGDATIGTAASAATVSARASTLQARFAGAWHEEKSLEIERQDRLLRAVVREPPLVEAEVAALAMDHGERAHFEQTRSLLAQGGALAERIRTDVAARTGPSLLVSPAVLTTLDGATRETVNYRVTDALPDTLVLAVDPHARDAGGTRSLRVRFRDADTVEIGGAGATPRVFHRVTTAQD